MANRLIQGGAIPVYLVGEDGTIFGTEDSALPIRYNFIFLGGERLTMAGAAQTATTPAGTNIIVLAAEGGDIRYYINWAAGAASPGYIQSGNIITIRAININSFSVYGANGAYANMMYYQE